MRKVVAAVADAAMIPAAAFLCARLIALRDRADVEIVLVSDSIAGLGAVNSLRLPIGLKYADFTGRLPAATSRISGAAFFRLYLANVLGSDAERILYLDADVAIENAGVFRLFDLDMKGQALAAVRDLGMTFEGTQEGKRELARVGASGKYFNSGVLLIDTRRYVAANLAGRIMEAALRERLHDQAAMNAVLRGDWLELSPAMNMTLNAWNSFIRTALPPVVVHFLGKSKPWHADFAEQHPIREEMIAFFRASPWRDFVQTPNFQQTWDRLQAAERRPTWQSPPVRASFGPGTDMAAVERYLRETRFADVEQGMTRFAETAIPGPAAA